MGPDITTKEGRIALATIIRKESPASLENHKTERESLIPVHEVIEYTVAETGYDTPIRLFIPEGKGPFPVVFYQHGGGFVSGDYATDEPVCRKMCADANVIVVSIQYRLSPEYPYPAAVHEVYDVIKWVVANAESFHVDPTKIAVTGNSAGATLAASACVLAAKKKDFTISYASLIYPPLDMSSDPVVKCEGMNKSILNSEIMEMFDELYIPDSAQRKEITASPIFASPDCFPRLSVFSAEYDPLSKEQWRFVQNFIAERKEILYKYYRDTDHGFLDDPEYIEKSLDCQNIICAELKSVFYGAD
ncbi:MAG: alpha/beta hydrolase [Clostridiales Family XIII bacterium]|jgi:acetyl esterase|nr:alpha/beta hydrolase [Clostridiales Family XIII bacterium]